MMKRVERDVWEEKKRRLGRTGTALIKWREGLRAKEENSESLPAYGQTVYSNTVGKTTTKPDFFFFSTDTFSDRLFFRPWV